MELLISASGGMEPPTAKVNLYMLIMTYTMVNFMMIEQMGLVFILIPMVKNTQATGKMIYNTEKVQKNLMMGLNMREHSTSV